MTQVLFPKTLKFHFEAPAVVSDDDVSTFKALSTVRNAVKLDAIFSYCWLPGSYCFSTLLL